MRWLNMYVKFQAVAEKTAKNIRGRLYFCRTLYSLNWHRSLDFCKLLDARRRALTRSVWMLNIFNISLIWRVDARLRARCEWGLTDEKEINKRYRELQINKWIMIKYLLKQWIDRYSYLLTTKQIKPTCKYRNTWTHWHKNQPIKYWMKHIFTTNPIKSILAKR